MKTEHIREIIAANNEDALLIDGLDGDKHAFDEAIIGFADRCGMQSIVAYDFDKVIDILVDKYDMDEDEAMEWYDFNMLGAYMGENTPIFVTDLRAD